MKTKTNKILIYYFSLFLFLMPYEYFFSTINKRTSIFNFLFGGRTIDIEPQPFRFIANIHYSLLYEKDFSLIFLFPILFISLYLNHKITVNAKIETNPSLKSTLITFSPYLFLNYLFYINSYFYCFFSENDFISNQCEKVDNYIFVSVMLIVLYLGFFNVRYILFGNKLNNLILITYTFLLLLNLKGSGYLNNYLGTPTYVDYQDLFNFESIAIFIFLFSIFKLDKDIFRTAVLSVCLGFYFKSSSIFIISFLLLNFLLNNKKVKIIKFIEDFFIIFLLTSISFSALTYQGGQDEHDLINEFFSISKTLNIRDYFPQYHLVIPLFFKNLLTSQKYIIFEFGVLMGSLNFLSLGIILYNLRKLTKKYFFIIGVFFLSFSVFITSNNIRTLPSQQDLLDGNFIVSLSYFQNTPLKLLFYSIFSTLLINYLRNENNTLSINICLILAFIDNFYIGLVISLAYLGTIYFSNYELKTFKNFLFKNYKLFIFITMYSLNVFSKIFFPNLFIYYSSSFRDSINLNFSFSGFHLVLLFLNLFIFIYALNNLKLEIDLDSKILYQFLIFNSFITFLFFIYFLGRSHPYNLYFVLFPFTVVCSLYFYLTILNRKYSVISFLILFLISNSIYLLYTTPNIVQYSENILFNDEIQLKYLNIDDNKNLKGDIEVPSYLQKKTLEYIGEENTLILGKYGSIIAHLNEINGHSPLINPVIVSGFQCEKIKSIIEKREYSKILISKSPFIYEYNITTDCFRKNILPLVENQKKFSLIYEEDFYKLYSKIKS